MVFSSLLQLAQTVEKGPGHGVEQLAVLGAGSVGQSLRADRHCRVAAEVLLQTQYE